MMIALWASSKAIVGSSTKGVLITGALQTSQVELSHWSLLKGRFVQIVRAEGPSGPNRDYLFQLEKALTLLEKHMLSMDWDCLGSVFWLSWNERDWMDFQGLKKHSCIRAHCSLFYMLSLDRQTICIDSWMLFGRTSNVSRNILYMMILF
ncbi:uncharacterized protein [Coffea arabica]|uniref:Uncharacterized protein isoform X8 n=1 Tax=Coffea arabica TaxID=13443 RepID=A0ABM4VWT5_COFAR